MRINSKALHRFPSTQRAWAATVTHRSAASARALRRRRPRISKEMHPAVPSRHAPVMSRHGKQNGHGLIRTARTAYFSKLVN